MGRRVDGIRGGESAQLQACRSKRSSAANLKKRSSKNGGVARLKRRRLEAYEERKSKAAEVRRMIDMLRDTV